MKKNYLITIAAALSIAIQAQTPFFTPTEYKGAFPVTDGQTGTNSNDWTSGWGNWDPENTNYPATNVTVSTDITTNTTWTSGQVVLLQNKVYVKNNATLTIEAGTIIRGDYATKGTLVITKGSKIIAQGNVMKPIVFTSNKDGDRAEGDWGGVVILGKGIINQPGGVANIEGITPSADTQYGGNNNADSSGIFSYVRIEFPGISFQPNKEINGLTLGAVGNKTKIDHVQVSFSGDDGFEWFGGAVNAKHIISFRNLDDDFDTDFGYKGNVQFGLIVRDKDLSDAAGDSNGFESDGEGTALYLSKPLTQAIFSNITSIGPKRDGAAVLPAGEKFERGVYIRRNSSISVFNSIITGWEKGLHVKDAVTADNFTTNDTAVFGNNIITADVASKFVIDAASNATTSFYSSIYTNDLNDTLKISSQINFVNGFPSALNGNQDFRLQANSVASQGASFTDAKFTGIINQVNNLLVNNRAACHLFPSVAQNQIQVIIDRSATDFISIAIYDTRGVLISKPVNNQKAFEGINGYYIDLSTVGNGIYFIKIECMADNYTAKLIVSK